MAGHREAQQLRSRQRRVDFASKMSTARGWRQPIEKRNDYHGLVPHKLTENGNDVAPVARGYVSPPQGRVVWISVRLDGARLISAAAATRTIKTYFDASGLCRPAPRRRDTARR